MRPDELAAEAPHSSAGRCADVHRDGRGSWLLGPAIDLLLGCGLVYVALGVSLFLCQLRFGIEMAQINPWLPFVILVTGIPHYGATLIRVCETREDRRRHGGPALLLGAAALCALVMGLFMPRLGSALITLYLSLSPWHYAAQNYGISMLFLKRRGIPVSAQERRWLRSSFVASYLLVLVSYHQVRAGGSSDPLYAASSAYGFLSLGLPAQLVHVLTPLLALIYVVTLGVSLRLLLRKSRPRDLAPIAALLFSQCCWFSLPALVSLLAPGRYPGRQVALAFIWIALGHCVQYLWISSYHHRAAVGTGGPGTALRYLAWATLLGASLWVVPAVVFAPGALGRVPFDAGLGLLIAAAVNLHHFALDARIWRLRDPRTSALLITGHAPLTPRLRARPARSRPPTLATTALITVGGLSVFAWIAAAWEREVGYRRAYAARDVDRLTCASERLAALGRDGPQIHVALGRLHQARGDLASAATAYRTALALDPTHAEARRRYEQVTALTASR